MVIPLILCFSSFLTVSYSFPWCFRMFPPLFLRFLQVSTFLMKCLEMYLHQLGFNKIETEKLVRKL